MRKHNDIILKMKLALPEKRIKTELLWIYWNDWLRFKLEFKVDCKSTILFLSFYVHYLTVNRGLPKQDNAQPLSVSLAHNGVLA